MAKGRGPSVMVTDGIAALVTEIGPELWWLQSDSADSAGTTEPPGQI